MSVSDIYKNVPEGRRGIRDPDEDRLPPSELARVRAKARRYVRVVSRGKPASVDFKTASDHSSTDGEHIVIGTDITESLRDSVLGLAIHEASHIAETDFDFVRAYKGAGPGGLPDCLRDAAKENGEDLRWIAYAVGQVTNMIEDRRIDSWCYARRPGFSAQIQSVYTRYDDDPRLTALVRSDDMRSEDWDSYMFRVSCITNEAAEDNMGALEKLRHIAEDIIDLPDIDRLSGVEAAYRVACDVVAAVVDAVEAPKEGLPDERAWKGVGDNGAPGVVSSLPGNAAEAFQAMIDHRDDACDNKERASQALLDDINAADADGADDDNQHAMCRVGGDGSVRPYDVKVVRDITQSDIEHQQYVFLREEPRNEDAVARGVRMGRKLADRLSVRSEDHTYDQRRRRRGVLDGRALDSIGFSDRLFYRTVTEEHRDAFVHVSLDASGSMRGSHWSQAIACVTAIATACDAAGDITCQVSVRTTSRSLITAEDNTPIVAIVYDSARKTARTFQRQAMHIEPRGGTPEGLCFEAVSSEIADNARGKDAYLVNLSDGVPMFDLDYRGPTARAHTREQIQRIRQAGVRVLSYFVGDDDDRDAFSEMYGRDARFVDVTNITAIAKTLNRELSDI